MMATLRELGQVRKEAAAAKLLGIVDQLSLATLNLTYANIPNLRS